MSDQASPKIFVASRTVLLFGEVLMDRFPDRDVLGGAPFNVARHLRGFGLMPVLVTRIGNDSTGAIVVQEMERLGMAVQGVQRDAAHPTGQVEIRLGADGHSFEILPDQAYDHILAHDAQQIARSGHPELIYFGTLAQRAASHQALRALLQASDAHAFLDVNLRDPWVSMDVLHWSLQHADTVKVNEEELDRIAAWMDIGGDTPVARGEALIANFGLQSLLVTRGEDGAWWLDSAGRHESVAGEPVADLVDSVGAGDAFASVCIVGHLQRWRMSETLRRARHFAACICRLRGAIPADDGYYAPFSTAWGLGSETDTR
ncbi:MAG: carbohydrate kinase [Thiobacillaceae bacterium]|jgi:fructokinase|nr:carbohydrate kinase [Thiobacillaceae bacterium]